MLKPAISRHVHRVPVGKVRAITRQYRRGGAFILLAFTVLQTPGSAQNERLINICTGQSIERTGTGRWHSIAAAADSLRHSLSVPRVDRAQPVTVVLARLREIQGVTSRELLAALAIVYRQEDGWKPIVAEGLGGALLRGFIDSASLEQLIFRDEATDRMLVAGALATIPPSSDRTGSLFKIWLCVELSRLDALFSPNSGGSLGIDTSPFIAAVDALGRVGTVGDSVLSYLNRQTESRQGLNAYLMRAWRTTR
jgi:hypothetical protein